MRKTVLVATLAGTCACAAGCGLTRYDGTGAGDDECDQALQDGLVGWWRFDEGTGNAVADSSEQGNPGSLVNGATWTDGLTGDAAFFADPEARVSVGIAPELGLQWPMTITAWVRPDQLVSESRHSIVGRDDEIVRQFEWGVSNSREPAVTLYPDCSSDGQVWAGSSVQLSEDGQWTHVSVTFSSDRVVSHYVNGVLAGSTELPELQVCSDTAATSIGGTPYGPYPWEGSIDEVRLYQRELSGCEVEAVRCAGTWHCTDGARNCGESAVDEGANC